MNTPCFAQWLVALIVAISGLLGTAQAQTWKDMQPRMHYNWAGLVTSFAVNPTNEREVFAGTKGGLYLTLDGGTYWNRVNGFPTSTVIDVAFCPLNANTLIATTYPTTVVNNRMGVFRSTDHGRTWAPIPSSTFRVSTQCPNRCGGWEIAWVPNSRTVYVGTDCGLVKSTDEGQTWQIVPLGPPIADPNDPNNYDRVGIDKIVSVVAIDATHLLAGGPKKQHYTLNGTTWLASTTPGGGCDIVRGMAALTQRPGVVFRADWQNKALHYTTDYGANWRLFPGDSLKIGNVGPMLKVSRGGGAGSFNFYFSDGTVLYKATLAVDGTGWNTNKFIPYKDAWGLPSRSMTYQHTDFHDLTFTADGLPSLLASDGGVQRWVKDYDCFEMVGGNRNGMNALELYGMGVYWAASKKARIFIMSWHNSGRYTTDDGVTWGAWGSIEDRYVNVPEPPLLNDAECRIALGEYVTSIWNCNSTGTVPVVMPKGSNDGHVVLFSQPGTGKQQFLCAISNVHGSNAEFYTKEVTAASWRTVGVSNFGESQGLPLLGRDASSNVTLYHPVVIGGKRKLIRIDKVNTTSPTPPRLPAMTGFGSIATGQENSVSDLPIAVDPFNANLLIAADADSKQVMRSTDGGETWTPNTVATNLVTESGRLFFNLGSWGCQVTEVAFDRMVKNKVYLGTEEAGMFVSTDGGITWRSANGPTKVMRISDIASGPEGEVYVASRGMGLWKYVP